MTQTNPSPPANPPSTLQTVEGVAQLGVQVLALAFPQYTAIVQGALTLLGVLDDLQRQGTTLTAEQRQQIEDTRTQLNQAWELALAAQNQVG